MARSVLRSEAIVSVLSRSYQNWNPSAYKSYKYVNRILVLSQRSQSWSNRLHDLDKPPANARSNRKHHHQQKLDLGDVKLATENYSSYHWPGYSSQQWSHINILNCLKLKRRMDWLSVRPHWQPRVGESLGSLALQTPRRNIYGIITVSSGVLLF